MVQLFDPNSLEMLDGTAHSIWIASGGARGKAFELELGRFRERFELRLRVHQDSGPPIVSDGWDLTDDEHAIDVHWWSASSNESRSGGARLWVDGGLAADLIYIDNPTKRCKQLRIGAPEGVDPGTYGEYWFGQFDWRE